MSRRYNFMPSRFAVQASRHVTPRRGDESRSGERDAAVTDGGQPADTNRTPVGVARDTHGTSTRCALGQDRDRPKTEAEREARAERRHNALSQDFDHKRMIDGLGAMRIMGRHATKPAPASHVALWCEGLRIPLDKGRAAYGAGTRDRARGLRCMCPSCSGISGQRLICDVIERNDIEIQYEIIRGRT